MSFLKRFLDEFGDPPSRSSNRLVFILLSLIDMNLKDVRRIRIEWEEVYGEIVPNLLVETKE